eukprot:377095_1
MGAGESSIERQEEEEEYEGPSHGWRILHVFPDSPCAEKGLVPYFDFVVGADNQRVDTISNPIFPRGVEKFKGETLKLHVYNIRSEQLREIDIVPQDWSGPGCLGMVVLFEALEEIDSKCLRVMRIAKNSPAAQAGLLPEADYLLGTFQHPFNDYYSLEKVLDLNRGRDVDIYVFNSTSSSVRKVVLPVTEDAGIGCEVSHGCLHRIPTGDATVRLSRLNLSPKEQKSSAAAPSGEVAPNHALPVGGKMDTAGPVVVSVSTAGSETPVTTNGTKAIPIQNGTPQPSPGSLPMVDTVAIEVNPPQPVGADSQTCPDSLKQLPVSPGQGTGLGGQVVPSIGAQA